MVIRSPVDASRLSAAFSLMNTLFPVSADIFTAAPPVSDTGPKTPRSAVSIPKIFMRATLSPLAGFVTGAFSETPASKPSIFSYPESCSRSVSRVSTGK